MHGLVSILDPLHSKLVESLWHELETECGLAGIKTTPFPHFSWLIAEDFDWPGVEIALQDALAGMHPFRVRTTGVALFTGPAPVIYVPLVRTRALSELHEGLWARTQSHGIGMSPLYSPERWMPHITLAYGDTNIQTLQCVMERLSERIYNWEIEIDNLALIYQITGQVGALRAKYELEKG